MVLKLSGLIKPRLKRRFWSGYINGLVDLDNGFEIKTRDCYLNSGRKRNRSASVDDDYDFLIIIKDLSPSFFSNIEKWLLTLLLLSSLLLLHLLPSPLTKFSHPVSLPSVSPDQSIPNPIITPSVVPSRSRKKSPKRNDPSHSSETLTTIPLTLLQSGLVSKP